MRRLKLVGATALLTAILPLATASTSLAQGPGPCTPPGNSAVGMAGPAMNGGQLMAGVGQCGRIGSWYQTPGYGGGVYGAQAYYGGPGYGGPEYYGGPGYYGRPGYYGGPRYGYAPY